MRAANDVLRSILIAFAAGCAVGFGLAALLVLAQGWLVGLTRVDYCALAGSLGAGMLVARRLGRDSPLARLAGPATGLLVSLAVPLAAWWIAPRVGFKPGEFTAGLQMALGALAGFVGVFLYNRKSRLPEMAEEIGRRRREEREREL
ncbi:MAG: hypothetical protein JRC92_10505 [Deltaproteobacteria bacterium]|nr:hypothetical protein [Deltaproteobacteria bacterium]